MKDRKREKTRKEKKEGLKGNNRKTEKLREENKEWQMKRKSGREEISGKRKYD